MLFSLSKLSRRFLKPNFFSLLLSLITINQIDTYNQACNPPKRTRKATSYQASIIRSRMARNWCTTKSWMATLCYSSVSFWKLCVCNDKVEYLIIVCAYEWIDLSLHPLSLIYNSTHSYTNNKILWNFVKSWATHSTIPSSSWNWSTNWKSKLVSIHAQNLLWSLSYLSLICPFISPSFWH